MKSNFIQIHPKDNVAVALEDVKKGCDVIINGFSQRMEVLEDISFGHKIALGDIKKGDMVITTVPNRPCRHFHKKRHVGSHSQCQDKFRGKA